MKQNIFTFLLISAIGLASCRKEKNQITIKQYDQQQIQSYISSHGLTGMIRDTTGGDTTGMYYKILNPGTQSINGKPVTPLDYPDEIAFVYTITTFDGTYVSSDTINNHFFDYVGHIASDKLPLGLQTAIHNLLKYPDASMRLLIPSHLAYGIAGTGSGSSQVANNRIGGNECLDYYIHAVNNFEVYDDQVIQNYMKANSLTGYTPVTIPVTGVLNPYIYWVGKPVRKQPNGIYYYKIITAPTATTDPITVNSTITATYTGQLFNAAIFDGSHNGTNSATLDIDALIPGVAQGLEANAFAGTEISLILPSSLGYQLSSPSGGGIPAFSCLRFTWDVLTVTP
jgi:FKBP-type peptidyl-prolyl cis-trans isomerase FkpA